MDRKEILLKLISDFCDYESHKPPKADLSYTDFLGYLNAQHSTEQQPLRDVSGPEEQWVQKDRSVNVDIAVLIIFLFRYAVFYGKKALKGSPLSTLDEFSFMIVLMTHKHLTKTELINKLIIEKTSGVEVIKRLLKNGMFEEHKNPDDKRSVLVSLTEKGKNTVIELLPNMRLLGDVVVGNLAEVEISSLSYLLRKLDYFHNENYVQHRENALSEMVADPNKSREVTSKDKGIQKPE
ncbi:winged helix-turn-helix transcriptional regulator [Mucilaginibacter pallidiroseus]|uniref:Winged helix-turn-helix transcriptional regulator n=1 Tax=Mucilaginibacter pallidiroseus TaxID=2599295 RepID=A0A563U105_9SPHI|nr:MarR family winged helix-turn-helix transcriptional regulator [Mucilaginibacter pallidiroseus]TWR24712.1 winged helix-turn-helix transcriptional regulator [Mucilaginibacter pallidiroseus]